MKILFTIIPRLMSRYPRIHPHIPQYLETIDIHTMTANATRPCSLLFPDIFAHNIQSLKHFLDEEMIDYKIYYANKASKSDIFVQTALENHI